MSSFGTAGMVKREPDPTAIVYSRISQKEIVAYAKKKYEASLRKAADAKGRNLWCVSFTLTDDNRRGTERMIRRLPDGDQAHPVHPYVDKYVWMEPPVANVMAWADPMLKPLKAKSYSISLENRPDVIKAHK